MAKQQERQTVRLLRFRPLTLGIALALTVILVHWTSMHNIAHATETCVGHDYYGRGSIHMHNTDCRSFPSSGTCQSLMGTDFCWQVRVSMDTYVVVYQLATNFVHGYDSMNYGPWIYRMSTHTGPINNAHYTSTATIHGAYDCGCNCFGGTCPDGAHQYREYTQHFYYRTQADFNSGAVEGSNYDTYF